MTRTKKPRLAVAVTEHALRELYREGRLPATWEDCLALELADAPARNRVGVRTEILRRSSFAETLAELATRWAWEDERERARLAEAGEALATIIGADE